MSLDNLLEEHLIPDLAKITKGYLSDSFLNLVGDKTKNFSSSGLIRYDPELMIPNIDKIKAEHAFYPKSFMARIFNCNASYANIENLKWLLDNKFPYNKFTVAWAAKEGNFDNIKWLVQNHFPYDEYTFAYAARNGNLMIIKWLFENQFPYDEHTFACSARNGNIENMKWFLEHKFPYDASTFKCAERNIDNMKWLLDNKFPYDTETFQYAALTSLENMK